MQLVSALITLVACLLAVESFAHPSKKLQSGVVVQQQDMHGVLQSIDERLRSLDRSSSVEARIEQKLDALEARLVRFEKIAENMSDRVVSREHVVRKFDAMYDRINHKLAYLEMKIELEQKKAMDKIDLMLSRFEKMEDTLTTREADIEVEISDVLSVIDDVKTSCGNIEANNNNITTTLQLVANDMAALKQRQLSTTVSAPNITASRSETTMNGINLMVNQIKEEFNDFSNKMSERVDAANGWWTGEIEKRITTIGGVLNATRSEQQNGLRNLVVLIGRINSKDTTVSDSATSVAAANNALWMKELAKKMDENFDNLSFLQNLFLESCHKIQMDETQIESKISDVLEKLIEKFEQVSTVEIKDIQNLEQSIKVHDTTIRRNLYTTSHNIGVLMQKEKEHKDELKTQLHSIAQQISSLSTEIDGAKKENANIYNKLKEMENELQSIEQSNDEIRIEQLTNRKLITSCRHDFAANASDNYMQALHTMMMTHHRINDATTVPTTPRQDGEQQPHTASRRNNIDDAGDEIKNTSMIEQRPDNVLTLMSNVSSDELVFPDEDDANATQPASGSRSATNKKLFAGDGNFPDEKTDVVVGNLRRDDDDGDNKRKSAINDKRRRRRRRRNAADKLFNVLFRGG